MIQTLRDIPRRESAAYSTRGGVNAVVYEFTAPAVVGIELSERQCH